MNAADPRREFAVDVAARLRDAGFEALWAGGCVRDFLLGKSPKDYDVATNATPEQVRKLFGHRQTVPVGASFGVIMVLGPSKAAGQIEVATFRSEGPYLDGRRPEHVVFCTAEEDAQRRDFTINGMFFDPLSGRVLDYVGGEADLANGVLRAIGDPRARMTEDKLRMLRAVRFAATLDFRLDDATAAAVRAMAAEIHVVSVERIAQELRRMLVDPRRRRAMELAKDVGLVPEILPEIAPNFQPPPTTACGVAGSQIDSQSPWNQTLHRLHLLQQPTFELAFAVLALDIPSTACGVAGGGTSVDSLGNKATPQAAHHADRRHASDAVWAICRRLKLSNDEAEAITWLVAHRHALAAAPSMSKAELKRTLAHSLAAALLELFRADTIARNGDLAPVMFVRNYFDTTPADVINPPPLVDGNDLIALGIRPGPRFKELLDNLRDAQLNGDISTRDEALDWLRRQP